ncbi:MAG: trehalase family glycosidase [Candidatus Aminicenantes bacterium]|nr:trehalase family glycosidase [Candidatus Aminicenantes bacterium]
MLRPVGKKPVFAILSIAIILGLYAVLRAEIAYPWKDVFIGSLDGGAWCGLTLIPQKDSAFGLRVRIEKDGTIIDGTDLFYMVSEVGPNAADGRYARLKFDLGLPVLAANQKADTPILIKPSDKSDTLTFEWSRKDERSVIGRVRAPKNVKVQLVQYFPWDFKGRYRVLPDGQVQGESRSPKPVYSRLWTHRQGEAAASPEGEELTLVFSQDDERSVYFVIGVGEDSDNLKKRIYRYQNTKTIDSDLAEEQDRYNKKRVQINGLYKGVPEAITDNLSWMVLYQTGSHRLYTPAGRRWIFNRPDGSPDHWQIFAWDSFFNALELSLESTKLAADAIKAVLETQYPNGNFPNWRSRFGGTPDRSQPPIGAYVVLKLFQKTGDRELLNLAYPYLKKWHSFWKAKKPNGQARRDGNGDGLLEWGSDRELVADKAPVWEMDAPGETRAKWESGMDDLPNWDDVPYNTETGTLTMNCLDLNCLYALDAWCLSQMAAILDRREDDEVFLAEYEKMKELINVHLWNQREGFYYDRHWDGRFSTRKAASNFYPLLARIPDERRAQLMLRHLRNPKEFWGDYVIPTISKDDPAFNDPKNPDRQYWRGTIWPPTNYLVYQGLKAYGEDALASEFAKKSCSLFMRSWTNFQLCPENFHPLTGEAAGQRFQSWGPLFALLAVEEYLDFTPWEGFRFGMIQPDSKGTLSRISIQGRSYDVEASKGEIVLREEGKEIVSIDGAAVVRHFLYSDNEVSFEIRSIAARTVKIQFLKRGKYQLLIDNQPKKIFSGRSIKFDVPEGPHTVEIQLLEELE